MKKRRAERVDYLIEGMIFHNDHDDMIDQRQIVAGSACGLNCEREHDGAQRCGDQGMLH